MFSNTVEKSKSSQFQIGFGKSIRTFTKMNWFSEMSYNQRENIKLGIFRKFLDTLEKITKRVFKDLLISGFN